MENEERIEEIKRIERGLQHFKKRGDALKREGEKYGNGRWLKFTTNCMWEKNKYVGSLRSNLLSDRGSLSYVPFTKRRKDFLAILNRLNSLDKKIYYEVIENNL